MTRQTLRQALVFAEHGWPVFPCQPGQKIPATTHGFRDATTDPAQIIRWFARHPDRNLAVATGAPGPDVLDVDQHGQAGNGFAALNQLRRAGLLEGASAYVRSPAADCTPTSPAPASATVISPDSIWTSGRRVATSWSHPPRSTESPTSCSGPRAATASLTGPRSPGCSSPRHCPNGRRRDKPSTGTLADWPPGWLARRREIATLGCSGPPTAPWRPTPPST
jgi:Bifunctional DNA primase/polymerase, N-terminal